MYLNLKDKQLYYEKNGSGPPLLLLHGNGEDQQIFAKLRVQLAQHFTVYGLDSRNHGKSSHGLPVSYKAMAADVRQFIVSLSLEQVSLLGFSDGAIIALLLAITQEVPLYKVALLGVNLSPADFTPETLADIQTDYAQHPSLLTKLLLEEPQIPLADLAKVTLPTLVVAGENDVCPLSFYQELTLSLPQGELMILPNHDHSSYLIGKDILAPTIISYFSH